MTPRIAMKMRKIMHGLPHDGAGALVTDIDRLYISGMALKICDQPRFRFSSTARASSGVVIRRRPGRFSSARRDERLLQLW